MREVMLILHFLGLSMGLGTSFAFVFLGRAASKLDPKEGQKFIINAYSLGAMGHVGLTLLLISGGYLMTPYWAILGSSPLLIAKLTLFLVLGTLVGVVSSKARKARQGDLSQLKVTPILGTLSLFTGIAIVICAVLYFK